MHAWGDGEAYGVVGWAGFVLALAALSDYALALYPFGFGSPEWELATIGSVVQGLPLLSIGLGAIWVSAGGLGKRWLLLTMGWGLLICAACVIVALLLFVTNVPMGLRATQGVARIGIEKLAAKTLFLGLLFSGAYIFSGVLALRQTRVP